ncbi:dihydroneopterin aldolase [Desulfurobacterium thermolithotrophum]|uniref:dihydroneopterin aldolase n=1 Tax=Desulfurobacterium thermolithotrophum TaxID=64160 RepID=UPI0013D61610|nr:dihydroneopterin aldolase [Desulfurobacterium thermolithotrophum]
MIKRSVFIEGMKLHVKCGVFEEERKLGVQVLIDVKVESTEFVDYQELYELIFKTASERQFTYLEDLGEILLNKIHKRWNPESMEIKMTKLSVPFQHSFSRAGVNLIWKR